MIKLFNDIKKMKSVENNWHSFKHESRIKKIIENNKFIEVFSINDLKENTFIYQPNGSQKSPDFIVKCFSFNFYIECKSGSKPVWNCHLPKKDQIYVYTNTKSKLTTFFLGQDAITSEQIQIYENGLKKMKKEVDKLNMKLRGCNNFFRGWQYYSRNMFIQAGGKINTDWCINSNEQEEKVFNFIEEKFNWTLIK